MATNKLLETTKFQVSPQIQLTLTSLDPLCKQLKISVRKQQIGSAAAVYTQILNSDIFNENKKIVSLLFIKLSIQNSQNKQNIDKKIMSIEFTQNVLLDKIIFGKIKVQNSIKQMNKKCIKKYQGVILHLKYPDQILIVLPKLLINNQIAPLFNQENSLVYCADYLSYQLKLVSSTKQ